MQLTFATYNIRKAIGVDRRRDPDRILTILRELDADIVALQEADRRFGRRASALPLAAIHEHTPYRPVPLSMRPNSMGWHGNALLVKKGIEVIEAMPVPLPIVEPRGAIRADLVAAGKRMRVVGMHLDLSGLRRRHQMRSILAHVEECGAPCPTVLMGDFNNWSRRRGCFREFREGWQVIPFRPQLSVTETSRAARSYNRFERLGRDRNRRTPQRAICQRLRPLARMGGTFSA